MEMGLDQFDLTASFDVLIRWNEPVAAEIRTDGDNSSTQSSGFLNRHPRAFVPMKRCTVT